MPNGHRDPARRHGTPAAESPRPPALVRRRVYAAVAITCAGALAAAACGGLLGVAQSVRRWGWYPDRAVVHEDTAYESGGVRIAVERFAPARDRTARRHPAVLVLHPSSGVRGRAGAELRGWADALARAGYVAFVVHYFDRTGDTRTDDAREDAAFPAWTAALEDAVTFARRDAAVAPARVSAFGLSLGGYMALALGAADPRVDRLVVLSGGFFDALAPAVRRLPPTLLLHGSDDDVVPLAEAWKVERALARLHVPHALIVYPGQRHGLDAATRPDGIARAVAFLRAPDDSAAVVAAKAASP